MVAVLLPGMLERLIKIAATIAVALIFFRIGPLYFWPFELLILSAAVLAAFLFLHYPERFQERAAIRHWFFIFALWYLFLILGTINAHVLYGPQSLELKNFILDSYPFFASGAVFLLIIAFGKQSRFRLGIKLALLAPILFLPFVLLPSKAAKYLHFLSPTFAFESLMRTSVTYFATLLLVALIWLLVIQSNPKLKTWQRLLAWLGTMLSIGLLLWTGVRTAWAMAFFSAMIIWIIRMPASLKSKHWYEMIIFPISLLLALIFGFTALPHRAQLVALSRFFPQITSLENFAILSRLNVPVETLPKNVRSELGIANDATGTLNPDLTWEVISTSQALRIIAANPTFSVPNQSRTLLWPTAAKLLAKNPWGLGMQYHIATKAIRQSGQITKAHNYFLEAGLTGGIGALIISFYILGAAIKSIKKIQPFTEESLWLTLSFWSIFLIAFVNGELFYTGWIVLALLLTTEHKYNTDQNQKTAKNFQNTHALA